MTLVREQLAFSRDTPRYEPTEPDEETFITSTKIYPQGTPPLTALNVYSAPARWTPGQGTQVQPLQVDSMLLPRRYIVAVDVNAHAHAWDLHQPEDHLGRKIGDWSVDKSLTILNDGSATRMNPATGELSAPDITLVTGDITGQPGRPGRQWGPTTYRFTQAYRWPDPSHNAEAEDDSP